MKFNFKRPGRTAIIAAVAAGVPTATAPTVVRWNMSTARQIALWTMSIAAMTAHWTIPTVGKRAAPGTGATVTTGQRKEVRVCEPSGK